MKITRLAVLLTILAVPASLHAIVGGKPAAAVDAPWMVALIDSSVTPSAGCSGSGGSATFCRHVCGGVLIAPSWVLTAAHCFIGRDAANIQTVIGTADLNAPGIVPATVSAVYLHPLAPTIPGSVYHDDIALLKLSTPSTATPASIADDASFETLEIGATLVDDEVEAFGWGRLDNDGAFPNNLQRVALDLLRGECIAQYFAAGYNTDIMTCAGEQNAPGIEADDEGDVTPLDPTGEDVCTLDSGGPLLISNSADALVAGIVSWGQDSACGEPLFPAVYTRAPAYTAWIESTTATAGDALVDLGVSTAAPTSAAAAATPTVTITLSNHGSVTAVTGAGMVVDFSGAALAAGGTSGMTCVSTTGRYTCTVNGGTLAAGASASATFTASAPLTNSALVIDVATTRTAGQHDFRISNDTAHHLLAFTALPDLRATIDGAVTQISGNAGTVALFVTARNASSSVNATGASLEIVLPAGHTLADDGALTCTGTSTLTCSLGTLSAGTSATYKIQLQSATWVNGTVDIGLTATEGDFPGTIDGQPDASATRAVTYLPPAVSSTGGGGGGGVLPPLTFLLLGLLARRRRG